MDTYLKDEKLKEIIYNIIKTCRNNNRSHFDTKYSLIVLNYLNYNDKFIDNYLDVLLNKEFIDALIIILDNYNKNPYIDGSEKYIGPSLIEFLCWIAENSLDNDKIKILRYIVDNYPNELEVNANIIYEYLIKSCYYSKTTLECLEYFSDPKYEYIHKKVRLKKHKRYIFNKYMDQYERFKVVEEEKENMMKRIEELELQIKYMPLGEEYNKAKEHFESLKY